MRENDKIKNREDERQIELPVWIAVSGIILIVAALAWFGTKQPMIINNVRDFIITFIAVLFFLIGTVLAILFFILASKLGDAREKIDDILTKADGKTEELADKITDVFRSILQPFIEVKSGRSGILQVLTKGKAEK